MLNLRKTSLIAGLLFGFTVNASAAISYNPDQLAQFNTNNQCANCDLSGAYLYGNHSGAVFSSSNLTGASGKGVFSQSTFPNSNLSSSDWSESNLSYAQMAYIPIIDANFGGANLSYANFEGSILNNSSFEYANLYGANISQQQLDSLRSYCWATLPSGAVKHC